MVLWDHGIECSSLINNTILLLMFHNNGFIYNEVTLGAPTDISNLCVYVWYEWTYYRDHGGFYEKI